jgi:hypothetical protein
MELGRPNSDGEFSRWPTGQVQCVLDKIDWKTLIFFERAVTITPNAWCGGEGAKLARRLGRLQPLVAVFPQPGRNVHLLGQMCIFWASLTAFSRAGRPRRQHERGGWRRPRAAPPRAERRGPARRHLAAPRRELGKLALHRRSLGLAGSEQDTVSAQKLGQLKPFLAVFPQECMG